jgi:hypothetical protein
MMPLDAPLNVVLLEPSERQRETLIGALAVAGANVIACASLAEAKSILDAVPASQASWAFAAPVISRGTEAISFFLTAQRRLPSLRWIVTPPLKRAPRARS